MDISGKLKNVAQIIVLIALCSCYSGQLNIPVNNYSYGGTIRLESELFPTGYCCEKA